MTNATPDPIFQVAAGFMAAKHLYVANEVGLFEQLADGPITLDELSQRTGIPGRAIRILADAMVALGFVDRQGDRYQNGPVATTFLSGRTPADLRPFLRFSNHIRYRVWTHLEESFRTGQAAVGHLNQECLEKAVTAPVLREGEDLVKIFSEGVEAATSAAAQALATTYDFSQHQRVLDLGGGTGSFLLAVLHHHSGLKMTLFEQPVVAALARKQIVGTPLEEYVNVVEGDFFKDPIPEGHDAVILANVVHMFSPEHNCELLRRTRERVPDGARLLLVDLWTDPTHTQPTVAALMAGEFRLVTGEGASYSEEEIREWLQQSRWHVLERIPLAGSESLMVAEAA